jgi:mRNA-degrading endonuclease toxin of MazEF toxin-antitoxin module
VTVVEVSTTIRGIPCEVPLGRRDKLPRKCVANADNLVTIPKTWLQSRLGPLSAAKVAALDRALAFSLGLSIEP